MRTRGILFIMAICAPPRVAPVISAAWNATLRSCLFRRLTSSDRTFRNQRRAVEAWRLLSEGSPKECSADFGDGFIAGYADYLNYGGTGDPPAVPPYRYRTVKYQTPEGLADINQWYAAGTMAL